MSSPDPITATDIITYIGVPLAVLGVLPILYTFVISILTQRRIRHLLISHGHKPHATRSSREEGFMLRASPMTSLIEVEMPRYTIAPVERGDGRYWEVSDEAMGGGLGGSGERVGLLGHGHGQGHGGRNATGQHAVERVESTLSMMEEGRVRGFLRGGSWRTFHWRRLVVGRKLYRIQYEDELREPPAEIEFSDLVNFLMDWGAELDGMGWEKLRSGGLWTPSGTVLLKVCDEAQEEEGGKSGGSRSGRSVGPAGDWVLRTSMPDDSDGILTLCVRWPPGRSYGSIRDAACLPPGWGRLRGPRALYQDDSILASPSSDSSSISSCSPTPSTRKAKPTLSETITDLVDTNKNLVTSTTLRLTLDSNLITQAHPETQKTETGSTISLSLLSHHTTGPQWFTTATSAILTLTKINGSLWGFSPPSDLTAFARKESIPCGVLVVLGILSAEQAPHWHHESDDPRDDRQLAMAHQRRFQARMQAERLEATMPPEQARVSRMNREMEERRLQTEQVMQHLAARKAREQKRLQEAMVSPRMDGKGVADACLAWLVIEGDVPEGTTVMGVAELVLYLMAVQAQTHGQKEAVESEKMGDGAGDQESSGSVKVTSMPVLTVLEEWMAWTLAGGMKREQLEMLQQYSKEFCYAACLVAVVLEATTVSTGMGKASIDMLECLRMWRKVRLG